MKPTKTHIPVDRVEILKLFNDVCMIRQKLLDLILEDLHRRKDKQCTTR